MTSKKTLLKKKKELISKLNKVANEMIPGSLYETKVNCRIKSCKKCQDGKKGHIANHLGYHTPAGKHKTTYIAKSLVKDIKKEQNEYKKAKKLLADIAEMNLLILKVKD